MERKKLMEKLIRAIIWNDYDTVNGLLSNNNNFKIDFIGEYNDGGMLERNVFNAIGLINDVRILKLILDHGGRECINKKYSSEGGTMLHEAAACGNLEVVKLLLENGAKVNVRDKDGRTPLLNAVYIPGVHSEIIDLLIEYKANVNTQDNEDKKVADYLVKKYIYNNIHSNVQNKENLAQITEKLLDKGLNIEDIHHNFYNEIQGMEFIKYLADRDNEKAGIYYKNNIQPNLGDINYVYNLFHNQGLPITINDISNANRDFIMKTIKIAGTDFSERISLYFHTNNAPMRDFIECAINFSENGLSQEALNSLENIATRFDNAIVNRNQEEIKNSISDLFRLCKTNENVYNVINNVINKDIIYENNNHSLTKLLNFYGFDTEAFYIGMRTDQTLTDGIRGINVLNATMDDGTEMSTINKYFKLVHNVIYSNEIDELAQNKDINDAGFLYQQNPTEENKNNLINTIINNSDNETKKSLLEDLTEFEATIDRPRDPIKVAKLEILLNGIGASDFGTCLKNRLERELQLGNNQQQQNNVQQQEERNNDQQQDLNNLGGAIDDLNNRQNQRE